MPTVLTLQMSVEYGYASQDIFKMIKYVISREIMTHSYPQKFREYSLYEFRPDFKVGHHVALNASARIPSLYKFEKRVCDDKMHMPLKSPITLCLLLKDYVFNSNKRFLCIKNN